MKSKPGNNKLRVVIGQITDPEFRERYAKSMFELRHEVFHDKLQWEVNSFDGMEFDEYDDADAVHIVVVDDNDYVHGSLRLRPTRTPYMLKDLFSVLLDGQQPPEADEIWEISRYSSRGPTQETYDDSPNVVPAVFGFNDVAKMMVGASQWFALQMGIRRYVMATVPPLRRCFSHLGFDIKLMAKSVRIGGVRSVALDWNPHSRPVEQGAVMDASVSIEDRYADTWRKAA